MRLILMAALLALAGCAARPEAEPDPRIIRVEVPIKVPCRTKDVAVPPWAATGLTADDSLEVKVRALLAERRQRIGYERELHVANTACW